MACSFTWAQDPAKVRAVCESNLGIVCVGDEYGVRYTGGQFLTLLAETCPIEFTDSVGTCFS